MPKADAPCAHWNGVVGLPHDWLRGRHRAGTFVPDPKEPERCVYCGVAK
ncbi:MAG: hypothetical protein M3O70_08810 [Actinomycetota bacterium]|nr:hypothetical protein [Actinomycetota bacterium]